MARLIYSFFYSHISQTLCLISAQSSIEFTNVQYSHSHLFGSLCPFPSSPFPSLCFSASVGPFGRARSISGSDDGAAAAATASLAYFRLGGGCCCRYCGMDAEVAGSERSRISDSVSMPAPASEFGSEVGGYCCCDYYYFLGDLA